MNSMSETMWVVQRTIFRRGHRGDEVAQPHPLFGVQPGGGLVQNQQLGVPQQGLGDAQPLPHPPGEAADPPAGVLAQVHLFQKLRHPAVQLFPGELQALYRGHVPQKLVRPERGVQRRGLGLEPQHLPVAGAQGVRVLAVPQHAAPGGPQNPRHHVDQGGFPGAVGPQQAVHPLLQGKGDVVQRCFMGVLLGQFPHFQFHGGPSYLAGISSRVKSPVALSTR